MRDSARDHKRQQDHHRRRAKAKMRELQEFCEEHDIRFVLEEPGTPPRENAAPPGGAPTLRIQA
jgi:sugar phosphate isomerase/epimerase